MLKTPTGMAIYGHEKREKGVGQLAKEGRAKGKPFLARLGFRQFKREEHRLAILMGREKKDLKGLGLAF